ncbi:hypothetical protein [Sinorhizobium psoraleae]|uniref:Uncharacterized protein n=1 Tax=Sinorhizobium psoraleae TaxID=520838 RepID=A0ABT4KH09_9HYPH|nr:hypothetical protein [Sinorhizobium psoraleae]MCZ4090631.1 hypothetical protein [Sinorhizobium psoraleae]
MSSDIQLRGDSLRRQTEASKKYAAENDLELIEDFKLEDIGVSAFKGKTLRKVRWANSSHWWRRDRSQRAHI